MFDNDFYWGAEKRCTARMREVLERGVHQATSGDIGVSLSVDLWEKSEDVARRVALLCDMELCTSLSGAYDDDYDDVSEIKPRASSNLFLAIRHVLVHQPDRAEGSIGLFASTVELERLFFEERLGANSISGRWPETSFGQYTQVRAYRMEDDPLARMVVVDLPDPYVHEEALYAAFYDQYIFPGDLDEEYEQYIRQFCRLTLELAGYCGRFCKVMSVWCGGGQDFDVDAENKAAEREMIARAILYSRAIAAFGLRFGYAQWLDTLDSRHF